jgi:hypothetical protein
MKQSDPGLLVSWNTNHCYNRSLDTVKLDSRDSIIRKAMREILFPKWKKLKPPRAGKTGFVDTPRAQQAAGTLFNTYTTAKSVLNPQAAFVAPASDDFWYPGKTLRFTVIGAESHRVTGPDTMTFQVEVGPAFQATIPIFTTGALNLTTTAHTTIPFVLKMWITCRAVGSGTSANCQGQGIIWGQGFAMAASLADGVANTGWAMAPNSIPGVGSGFDSTVANVVDLFVAQSFNGAGNGVQIQIYTLESLN